MGSLLHSEDDRSLTDELSQASRQRADEQHAAGQRAVRRDAWRIAGDLPASFRYAAQGLGYGFISRDDDSGDIFVHFSKIAGTGYRNLEEGQRVEFEVGPGRKGDEALDVRVV